MVHKICDLESKVPEERAREVLPVVRLTAVEVSETWARELPAVVACFEACIVHLRLPISDRRVTRTTNLLDRIFAEERRRTKMIPHPFGKGAVMKLRYAAIFRASQTWRGVRISEFEQRQLKNTEGRTRSTIRAEIRRQPKIRVPFAGLQQSRDLTCRR